MGRVMRLDEPLSFWGGVDPMTGRIIEPSHPQYGESIEGRILLLPHGRGSSSSSSILAEALRRGHGPAAIVLEDPDAILVIGSLVAHRLYGTVCPMVVATLPSQIGGFVSVEGAELRQVGADRNE